MPDVESDNAPILAQVTKAKQEAETAAILGALSSTRWNRKQAAALLKIDYKALLYKMKTLSISEEKPRYAADGHVNGKEAPAELG
jgi:DNA-binding NtrC family response regulator